MVDIRRAAERRGKCLPLFTDTEIVVHIAFSHKIFMHARVTQAQRSWIHAISRNDDK